MIRLKDVPAGDESGLWAVTIATVESTFRDLVESYGWRDTAARRAPA